MSTKDYLFSEDNSKLVYKGVDKSFDLIYKNIQDPWGQSDISDKYYLESRKKISETLDTLLKNKTNPSILEIGCGNGFSTSKLITMSNCKISGCDISKEAISQAKSKYPEIAFFVHNIKNKFNHAEKYDIILISNLLWYILKDLKVSFDNCFSNLKKDGKIIFFNAFLKNQRYGKDIIDGLSGMENFIVKNYPNNEIELVINDFDIDKKDHRYFGLLVIKS